MNFFRHAIILLISFSSGVVISGAVFALIAVIGVVPRLAQKTNTTKYLKLYEEAIVFGGILGTLDLFINLKFNLPYIIVIFFNFCTGIFFGCLAVSLAEVIDVIPIITRRGILKKGLPLFILALALGKLFGSIWYFIVPGFYTP